MTRILRALGWIALAIAPLGLLLAALVIGLFVSMIGER